jgi:hypothetical protein
MPKVGICFSSKIKYWHNIEGNPCWLTEMRPHHQLLFRWALVKDTRYIPSPSCYLFQVFAKELRYIPGFTSKPKPLGQAPTNPTQVFKSPDLGGCLNSFFPETQNPLLSPKSNTHQSLAHLANH